MTNIYTYALNSFIFKHVTVLFTATLEKAIKLQKKAQSESASEKEGRKLDHPYNGTNDDSSRSSDGMNFFFIRCVNDIILENT